MNKKQVEILGEYINYGKVVILIENIPDKIIEKGAVVIDANCSNEELNGKYVNLKYESPEWYNKLIESSKKHIPVLIIKNINKIAEAEQRKFIEIFKYKKSYINKLPENCVIFATYSDLEKMPIEKETYSFMVHI